MFRTASKKEKTLKIISRGELDSGATSLLIRKAQNEFFPNQQPVGITFFKIIFNMKEQDFTAQLWDFCGGMRQRRFPPSHFRNANALLIVYDISNRESFSSVHEWINDFSSQIENKKVTLALVGTKIDQEESRQVSKSEGEQLAQSLGIIFFEISSKLNIKVDELFEAIFDNIITTQ